jgi:hypothetical protein
MRDYVSEVGRSLARRIQRVGWLVVVCLWVVALWIGGGCVTMQASSWGKSGGGFVRLFGDAGPQKPFGPETVSQWMAQPRPQP